MSETSAELRQSMRDASLTIAEAVDTLPPRYALFVLLDVMAAVIVGSYRASQRRQVAALVMGGLIRRIEEVGRADAAARLAETKAADHG